MEMPVSHRIVFFSLSHRFNVHSFKTENENEREKLVMKLDGM